MITGSKDTWGQTSPLDERSSLYTVGTGSLGRVLLGRVVLPWDGFCCLGTGLGWVMVPGGEFGTGLGWVLVPGGGFATGWGRPPAALAGTSSSST